MADENKEIINRLSQGHVPATREGERAEPTEPRQPTEAPAARETAVPRETETREVAKPKEKEPAPLVEVDGKKLSADEIKAALTTSSKYSHLQEKYNELLEKSKATPVETKPVEQPKPITNLDIAQKFDPIAHAMLPELVKEGLVDADMAELYPRTLMTMIGQVRWLAELITDARTAMQILIPRVAEMVQRTQSEVMDERYVALLDKLQDEGEEFKLLKDSKVRDGFVEYLKELDPQGGKAFGEKGGEFVGRQWFAYNHEAILEASTGKGKGEPVRTDKRLVAGEGGSGRPPAAPKSPDDPMNRMINEKLGKAR